MLALGFGFWDVWELNHKVTFDGRARTITVNPNITEIDVQIDIYSDWKEWVRLQDHLKFTPAIRSIGGDPTTGIQKAGDIYFLRNNWRIVIDLSKTRVTGVIFSDDFETPFIDHNGREVYQSLVSSLVTNVTTTENVVTGDVGSVWDDPRATELSQKVDNVPEGVWDYDKDLIINVSSIGYYIKKKILNVKRFIGLK